MITGSTDGIGLQTAERLAGMDATLLVHGRTERKADMCVFKLKEGWDANTTGFAVDFASLDEVRLFGKYVADNYPFLDGVLLNAGTYAGGDAIRETTEDGDEYQFCVNVMAPFLLASILLPTIWKAKQGRLVVTTANMEEIVDSNAKRWLDDLFLKKNWTPKNAFYLSKLALAMVTYEINERYGTVPNFTVNQFDPGKILTKIRIGGWGMDGNPPAFANDALSLLTNEKWSKMSGKHFKPGFVPGIMDPEEAELPAIVLDAEARQALWDKLVEMTEAEWPEPPKSIDRV